MWRTITDRIRPDPDMPARARTLDIYARMLDGTIYDVQPSRFHEERSANGEYVPVKDRAPSVRSGLCRSVVDDAVALLFGEGRFPEVTCEDRPTVDALSELVRETSFNRAMVDAAVRGSIGSVAVLMRVLRGRVFWVCLETRFLTPAWDPEAPDTLTSMRERYKAKGRDLAAQGYAIPSDALTADWWFSRVWDDQTETWHLPVPVSKWRETRADQREALFVRDVVRSVTHRLGFVPIAWMRAPGQSCTGDPNDGDCVFRPGVETVVALDYLLSAGHRAQLYMASPRLVIKEPSIQDGLQLGPADALIVSGDGDAKLLEIDGGSTEATLMLANRLRETALEAMHGNRSNADKLSAAQSGRALELLHQPLVWLADKLRIAFGQEGMLPLLRMVVRASAVYPITVGGAPVAFAAAPLGLRWPGWFAPTHEDLRAQAGTLSTLRAAGFVSRETAIRTIASDYDIEDVPAELARIAADEAAADARAAQQAMVQTKITETTPG